MSFAHRFSRIAAAVLLALPMAAQPPLATIRDVLFKADGTRFNGIVHISWTTFEAGGPTTIPQQDRSVRIIDGHLFVQLAPTAGSSPAAYYTVKYWSDGHIAFTEHWTVPASSSVLAVRDVRLGDPVWPPGGGATGGTGIALPINQSDVTGLVDDLSQRPEKGPAFLPNRAAVINAAGAIEGASGAAPDCVRVDGTSVPCATAGTLTFVDGVTPSGTINGANAAFVLPSAPSPAQSLLLFRNGLLQKPSIDFTLAGTTVTFLPGAIPQTGDTLLASYRW